MEEDTGFYRVTYDVIHKEFRVEPRLRVLFGPTPNRVECIDDGLKIYSVHVHAKDIVEGRDLGEILLKNHVGEDWRA